MKKNAFHPRKRLIRMNIGIALALVIVLLCSTLPSSMGKNPTLKIAAPQNDALCPQRGGWELLDSGVTEDLNGIFFICLNRGSVVGDEGVILRTGDGGVNWTTQNSGVIDDLYDISYYGYSIILAVGASGTILFTNNTGENWTVKQTGMMASYYSGQMISDTIGVAVGVNAIFQPFVTRTNDGWNSWQSTSFYIEHNSVFYEGRLTDVYFLNTSVGFATAVVDVPTGGAIVHTTDGGGTWETVYFSSEELFGIDFTSDGIGYAIGDHGVILQSVDDGQTWASEDSGVTTRLHAVDFASETKGVAVGDNGVILRTEDAGSIWIQQTSGTTNDLFGVRFITERVGVVIGKNGVILRTTTGGYPDDTAPPETNCTLTGILQGDIYISNVTVMLSATDDISGVASTVYKLDDGLWTTYTEPFQVTSDGNHLLRFYSIDNVGNAEQEKTRGFTIQHPPEIRVTLSGGIGLRMTIQNLGSSDLKNASWNLILNGGIIVLGKQKSGVVTVNAGSQVVLNSFVLGIGKPIIILTLGSSQTIVQGSVFFVFVRISG
jgi:photosystem II stability/assembly factor-like uncharacterized protein